MGNRSGAAAISLPTGGGSLQGLGGKFSPDLHTGTCHFAVPVDLPAGRNGLQPDLALEYSTSNGNGPFGLGWSLSIPQISRQTSAGVPLYDDTRDRFVLSGADELVPTGPGRSGTTLYRPRTESLYARIEKMGSSAPGCWEVRTREGLLHRYGSVKPAVTADPENPTRTFAWKLQTTEDPFGNRVEYIWEYPQKRITHEQSYLKEIRYNPHGNRSNPEWLVIIRLHYEEDRPDPFSDFRAGFEIRTTQRCNRIEVLTRPEGQEVPVRSYTLSYDESAPNGLSLLSRIDVIGLRDKQAEQLPPLTFAYSRFQPERRRAVAVSGADLPPVSLGHPGYALADLHGSGLPDIVELDGPVARYWRNLGDGRFDLPRSMKDVPAGLSLSDPGIHLLDADGDGRLDLVVSRPGQAGFYPSRFGGSWDSRSFQAWRAAPTFDLNDPEVRLIDLDGDGVTDVMRGGSGLDCFFNHPKKGWSHTRSAIEGLPSISFADPRVRIADMNGDGLQDLVLVGNGRVEYWPSQGHGRWGRRVVMKGTSRLPYGYDPARILLGDLDGDGAADLVYVGENKVTLWINQSGNGWSEPVEIMGTPSAAGADLRLVDLLGTGISGILWSFDTPPVHSSNLWFLDLCAGTKPGLLEAVDNHHGAITRITYAPSTFYYLKDAKRPATRWKTPLPFPVQVVASVTSIDAISGSVLTEEFSYHHGYWDGYEREFRGFGRVDHRDTQVRAGPGGPGASPVETRSWFHLGAVGDPYGNWHELDYGSEFWSEDPQGLPRPEEMSEQVRNLPNSARRDAYRSLHGSALRTEIYALDGSELQDRPYMATEECHGFREESRPGHGEDDRVRIFAPQLVAQRATTWEGGKEPHTTLGLVGEYNRYGLPQRSVQIAVPRGRDWRTPSAPTEPYLATVTFTSYACRDDETAYIVDRTVRTTEFSIRNDGSQSAIDLARSVRLEGDCLQIISDALVSYDGPAFEGLPPGELGRYGAEVRTETLVLTDTLVRQAHGETAPACLSGLWTDEYPQEFRLLTPPALGYIRRPLPGPRAENGYYAATAQVAYDFQINPEQKAVGLTLATRDPLGHVTRLRYDQYQLLLTETKGPNGLTSSAAYDYRTLHPSLVTDSNGNRTAFTFTPLGHLESVTLKGKPGEAAGDTSEHPTVQYQYDWLAFAERQEPISVRTIRRVEHVNSTDLPPEERDRCIETVEYSDGFGRLLQMRTTAEPGNGLPAGSETRVRVAYDRLYDHKGRVVEQYEPYFALGWAYLSPGEELRRRKVLTNYDPLGRKTRIIAADGSETLTVHGVPGSIAQPDVRQPDRYEPTPWESYVYDPNDNVYRTHPERAERYPWHADTPTAQTIDPLGRVTQIAHWLSPNPQDRAVTHTHYDLHGRPIRVIDPMGREAASYLYDLAGRAIRTHLLDTGPASALFDAAGHLVEARDAKEALALSGYDNQGRPIYRWARDHGEQPVGLRERLVYGDSPDSGLTPEQARGANLLGALYQHDDETGRATVRAYDLHGNPLETERQVISDQSILEGLNSGGTSWQLDPVVYRISRRYDALSRITALTAPTDGTGKRRSLSPHYDDGGRLESLKLDDTPFIGRVAYDARGHRTLVHYGCGVMTHYAYDPETVHLLQLRSERFTAPLPNACQPTGEVLQDFGYEYDLAGHLITLKDRTPGCGVPDGPLGPDALDRTFRYDPLYRLTQATGRECKAPLPDPWSGRPRCDGPSQTRSYTDDYRYDLAGNLTLLTRGPDEQEVRSFEMADNSNRVSRLRINQQDSLAYEYDRAGNIVREGSNRRCSWGYGNQLRSFSQEEGQGGQPSLSLHLYDGLGRRVKTLVRTGEESWETKVCIDGFFEHLQRVERGSVSDGYTLHVMDGPHRIAEVCTGSLFGAESEPSVYYHLSDHLGSSNLLIDVKRAATNREEYTPYGETSFGGVNGKRYRFTGKERDLDSGLYYHGARYYAPWLCRWISSDPAGLVDGPNTYAYVRANPMNYVDPSGTARVWNALSRFFRPGFFRGMFQSARGVFQPGVFKGGFRSRLVQGATRLWRGSQPLPNALAQRPSNALAQRPSNALAQRPSNALALYRSSTRSTSYTLTEIQSFYDQSRLVLRSAGAAQKDNYKPDTWRVGFLYPGQKVYQLWPGPSEFYTDKATLEAAGYDAATLYKSLQTAEHKVFGRRFFAVEYTVEKFAIVGDGTARVNEDFGIGGGGQQFIMNRRNLKVSGIIRLLNGGKS